MSLFQDKIAIVTGGASGIGRALGHALARRGAHVVMADVQKEMLREAVGAVTRAGFRAEAVELDVADPDAVKAQVEKTANRHGRLDYLFNNAGIAVGGEVRDCALEDWQNVLNVNLMGVVHGVTAAYPIMVRQGFGHIVNTASIEGLVPFPGAVSYVASKYGVVGLSNALGIEGAALGVRVSVVCPGFVKTPIFETSKMVKLDRRKVIESLPHRFGITPEACAEQILMGVARNKAIIVVTGLAKVLWALHRICPALVMWLMRRDLRKGRREIRIEDE
jgi:NAD(P)-dependent dehydrogenase (short-subunit alcohol dehydrogenase family)